MPPDPCIAVVTGATGGIGRWVAAGLAEAGCHVVLTGRDAERGAAALAWLRERCPGASTELMLADLSSLAETRALAARIAEAHPRLHILVNNAGIFRARPSRTAEGHDLTLATNLLSPFLLMRALEPALRAGAEQAGAASRIVTVGSSTSDHARLDPATMDQPPSRLPWHIARPYARSKLAVMLATFEQARRLDGLGVVAHVVHPGAVATGLVRARGPVGLAWRLITPWLRTEQAGAATPLHAALSPAAGQVTGRYYKNCAEAPCNPRAHDPALRRALWAAAERLIDRA